MFNASKYLEKGLGIKIDENITDMINNEASFVEFPEKHIVLLEGMRAKKFLKYMYTYKCKFKICFNMGVKNK